MELITCKLGYSIVLDYEFRDRMGEILSGENIFIITDTNVYKFYRAALSLDNHKSRLHIIRAGEDSKQLAVAGHTLEHMVEAGCNRKTTVIALGGGVVGDLAGFVAAIFMRGVPYIQVPTTLLAMVDSSIGGKTAVDLGFYKNMIGAFKQPIAVEACVDFLATLNLREFRSGLGEVIKTALLDKELFEQLKKNLSLLFASDSETLYRMIAACIRYKAKVVEEDEHETGKRKVLNLGHTVGHALEAEYRHKLSHGEYVLNGVWYEVQLARFDKIIDEAYAHEVERIVETALDGQILPIRDVGLMMKYLVADKKNSGGFICPVLPVAAGETRFCNYEHTEFRTRLERLKCL